MADPFALSNKGGVITLVDEKGLKVDGVSYTKDAGQAAGLDDRVLTLEVRSEVLLRSGASAGGPGTGMRYRVKSGADAGSTGLRGEDGADTRAPSRRAARVGVGPQRH